RTLRLCLITCCVFVFFFSSRRRHTRFSRDWSSDVCSSDLRAIFTGLIAESEKEEYYEKVDSIVKYPELQMFFSNQGRVLSEIPLLKKNTKTLKPDRIVLIENKAYLLDYKTGEVHNKYDKQLETYADALEEMGYTVVKKLLVYIQQDDIKIIHLKHIKN